MKKDMFCKRKVCGLSCRCKLANGTRQILDLACVFNEKACKYCDCCLQICQDHCIAICIQTQLSDLHSMDPCLTSVNFINRFLYTCNTFVKWMFYTRKWIEFAVCHFCPGLTCDVTLIRICGSAHTPQNVNTCTECNYYKGDNLSYQ